VAVGTAYMSYYKFKDAVRETTQHRGTKSDAQIHDRVFELANEYDIPVTDENLTIIRQEDHTIVDGSYIQPIDIVPRSGTTGPSKSTSTRSSMADDRSRRCVSGRRRRFRPPLRSTSSLTSDATALL